MRSKPAFQDRGPFRAAQLRSGDPYELSNGHAVLCLPMLPGKLLTAPGVLKNPVRVEALYDRDEAERATLTNLLQRQGYEDLGAVLATGRNEGRSEGLATAVVAVLEARGIRITKTARDRIARCTDAAELDRWVRRAAVVQKVAELFEEE